MHDGFETITLCDIWKSISIPRWITKRKHMISHIVANFVAFAAGLAMEDDVSVQMKSADIQSHKSDHHELICFIVWGFYISLGS